MSVNNKHIATFLLGAAAALAAQKYLTMSDEEKQKLASDIKDKANNFKTEAENFADKAKDYFEELKVKGGEALKEHMADAEQVLKNLFDKKENVSKT
jgi:isopenicillin N synthase-like dioxygenase